MTQGQPPGGRATRGPAIDPGGDAEPHALTPPYDGRKDTPSRDDAHSPFETGDE